MSNCLEKSCAFGLLNVYCMDVCQFVDVQLSFLVLSVGCGI